MDARHRPRRPRGSPTAWPGDFMRRRSATFPAYDGRPTNYEDQGDGAVAWGPRGGDPGSAREDRGVDRGAGFFGKRAQVASREKRRAMIVPGHLKLSLSRQCHLFRVNRSSLYHRPKGGSAENPALCTEALTDALERYRRPRIFNTGQGSQFTVANRRALLSRFGTQCHIRARKSQFSLVGTLGRNTLGQRRSPRVPCYVADLESKVMDVSDGPPLSQHLRLIHPGGPPWEKDGVS